jgi:hypothetical protein
MQRSALVIVLISVLSAGTVASADETPPDAAQTQSPSAPKPPPDAIHSPPAGTVQSPAPGAAQTSPPPHVPQPPSAAETPQPSQGAVQPPASGSAEAPPATVQAPPAQSAVQSVAPDAAEAILGQRVTDQDGKDIGRLVDVLVDASGQPQAAVIDFGGFMGVGNRKVAVHWSALHFSPGDAKRKVTLEMTPDQIKAAPEFLNSNKAAPVVTPANAGSASP